MLGSETARAIQLVNNLRSAGTDFDLNLPRIAFVGKQSSAKSSIVEAVTGVQLSRAHGTCTRCPIEVRTRRSDAPWRCTVSLRVVFDDDAQTPQNPQLEHFRDLQQEEHAQLAECISAAQEKLLSLGGVARQFTRNVVCVELSGPACGDLALIDLPGLIQSTESQEDEVNIERVRSLCESYMAKTNTIIVQCIQSDEDVENQVAAVRMRG